MLTVVAIVFDLLLIVAALVATSVLIVAKKPDAAKMLDKLAPYQALIGILLIILGIVFFLVVGPVAAFKALKVDALPAMANLLGILIAIVLGFLFALPQLVGLAPGSEQRARELADKVLPFQLLLGLGAAGCGVIGLLHAFGVLKFASTVSL